MRLFTTILFLVLFLVSQAQDIQKSGSMVQFELEKNKEVKLKSESGLDIAGSPYLFDEMKQGIAYLNVGGGEKVSKPMLLNLYSGKFIYEQGKHQYFVPTGIIDSVRFNDQLFVYQKLPGVKFDACVEVVAKNTNDCLLLREKVVLLEAENRSSYSDPIPPRYKRQNAAYFYKLESKEPVLIKSKKDVYSLFSEEESEIKTFIKKNKIKFNKRESMIKLFKFVSSL